MRYLVTRPEPGAGRTAAALRALGHDPLVDPMLRIVFTGDPALPLDGVQAVAATSANALRAIAAHPDRARAAALPLYTVGAASAEAAEDAGFGIAITADGDVAALADLMIRLLDPQDGPVLYAAGHDRRGNLEKILNDAGLQARLAEVYRADLSETLAPETVAALAGGRLDGVLIFSTRTAEAFVAAVAKAGLSHALQTLPVFAISEAAAAPLAHAGATRVALSERPDSGSVLSMIPPCPDAGGGDAAERGETPD